MGDDDNSYEDPYRDWAGAYALGALEPNDRREFEHHLQTCTTCSGDVRAFAPLPGLIAQIDPADLDHVGDPAIADEIAARVRANVNQLETSRARWRWVGATAAAGVAILAGIVVVSGLTNDAEVAHTTVAAITSSEATHATVQMSERSWGTEIQVELNGLPQRDLYQLWAVDVDGSWSVAATWGATPTGDARVVGATSVAADSLDRIVVTTNDRNEVLVEATT